MFGDEHYILMDINLFSYEFPQPVGWLGIADSGGEITRVIFNLRPDELYGIATQRLFSMQIIYKGAELVICKSELNSRAAAQLEEYFDGRRPAFDLPLRMDGPAFTKSVYRELLNIPPGQTRSYKEIAVACGNPRAYRAVGMANNKNPIPIIVPCHRVIGSDGGLTGYAGGLEFKRYLLDLENRCYI